MTLFFSPAQPLLLAYSPQNKIIFCKKTNSKKGTDQNLVCSIFTTFAQMPNHFFLVGSTFAPVRADVGGEAAIDFHCSFAKEISLGKQ